MSSQAVRLFAPESQGSTPFVSSEPTIGQVLDWFEQVEARGSTAAGMERRRVWRLLRGQYGGHLVSSCRPFDLLNFINGQPGVQSDWTRKRWNATCQRPFNHAEKLGLIIKNPFRGLTFPEGEDGRDWTRDEYQAVLRNSDPVYRRLLVWLRFSGMRPGEARGMEWPDIKFESGVIRIEKHKTRKKSKKPRRIPFNRVLVALLAWCKRHNPGARFVFNNTFGKPWSCKAVDKRLAKLRARLGLAEDLKLHGLRHTFATNALMNDVNVAELMELLGHEVMTTTQRYTHLVDKVDHLHGAMAKAVSSRPKVRPTPPESKKPDPPMPLFERLE
jgi:integrase